jgi:hypothetical protein
MGESLAEGGEGFFFKNQLLELNGTHVGLNGKSIAVQRKLLVKSLGLGLRSKISSHLNFQFKSNLNRLF